MFKFVAFATLLAFANAGVPLGLHGYAAPAVASYSAAPAVSHAYISTPAVAKVAAPVAYSAPAYSTYAAPVAKVAYSAPTYSTYAAPSYSYSAPTLAKYAPAPVTYSAPVVAKYASPVVAKTYVAEPVAPAAYDFAYAVNDPHTGDSKTQQESRQGDVVHGSYSLVEADGTKRIVEYTADAHNGFNAVVHKEGEPVVKAVAPVAYSAPVAKVVSPYAYSAPIAKVAAPVAYAAPAYYH
ncbi:cuticle protein 21-like [Onthophagus taurus]|uniref:cuticle protein 21-like n=1 Tax=Onthophagus taurus TaxID=166361 RepID=UPI0039BE0E3C